MTKVSIACFLLIVATGLFGQTTNQYTPMQPIPVGDILLTLPSSHMADANTWEVRFSHRFNQSVDGNGIHSLFGLDSGANVGLGLSYVPFRDLEVALMRQSTLETYEGAVKYGVVQQARALPVSAAVRVGVDWRNARNLDDRSSLFAQAIVSRQFGSRFDVYVVPTWITKAGRVVSGNKSVALFDRAFNVPVGALVQIMPGLSVVGELIPTNRDLPRDLKSDLGWSLGIKRAIGGHLFEILLTNSNGMTTDQYISSTYNGAPLRTRDKRLGFNIERRWGKGARR
ncbi:MAG TPA: DUF5777 family beta-barrel protein [Thermoanaerobaculia bacterium]